MTMTTLILMSAVPFAAMAVCRFFRSIQLRRDQQGEIIYEVTLA